MKSFTKTLNKDSTITLERLYKARYHCAYFMSEDKVNKVKLLPIFERLEREIAIKKEQERLLAQALAIANIPFETYMKASLSASLLNTEE